MEVMIRKGKIIILFLILISGGYMSLFAQISSTAQKLDGFSFKKGLSIGGGLSLMNFLWAVTASFYVILMLST